MDNASVIAEQCNLDNKKTFKDYTLDIVKMGKEAVSIIIGNSSTVSQLESSIAIAIDGVSVLAENTDNWINAISDLETIVQNYKKYDEFLKLIEENSEGELKEAATTLRKGMSEAIEIKLSTYIEVSNKNLSNYSEFFFSDMFFTILKKTPQYNSDENLKFFTDCGDEIVTKAGTLKSSWDLGVLIGKLVGNITVGGENIINRLLETMALYDISVILQGKIIDLSSEFLNKYGSEEEETVIESYILYSQYLIGCRIRGEYCIYSIIANDAGLLSWFNKKSAEEAKLWYENKVNQILNIQDNLLNIYHIHENEYDSVVDMYIEFINDKVYERYIDNWVMPAIEYAILDINQDGVPELLINSELEMEWGNTLIFSYDVFLEEIVFIQDIYHFSDIRYSLQNKALVYTDIRPDTVFGVYSFDTIKDMKLNSVFTVGKDTINIDTSDEQTYYFICETGKTEEIIEDEEGQEYFSELKTVDFMLLPTIKQSNVENDLYGLLKSSISDTVLNFIYDDFDNDGVYEAIAFCGEYYEDDGSYFGTLYFVSRNGVQVIKEKDTYWDGGQVYNFDNAKIIAITKYFTTGGLTYYYQINGDEVTEIEGSGYGAGLYQDEQGRMYMTDSQYDACVDGTGHTWNIYYFYWDNGLKEYGGTQISIDEFLTYEGSNEVGKKIAEDGYEITSIYKRKNGIMNVNCCDGWSNSNIRMVYDDKNIELLPVTEDFYYEEGIIKPALIPEIATY